MNTPHRLPDRRCYTAAADCLETGGCDEHNVAELDRQADAEQDDDAATCECCDSRSQHDAAVARQMAEFLDNPGPPPAHFTREQAESAQRGIDKARAAAAVQS